MNMDQVGSILDRPKLYYNIDGVGELGGGFTMLGFALLMWLQAHSPSGAIWHQMYAFVIYMAVMLSIIHYGSKAIKERITYPRTGFVEYRKRDRVRPGIMAALVAPLALVGLFVARRYHWDITAAIPLFVRLRPIRGPEAGRVTAGDHGGIGGAARVSWSVRRPPVPLGHHGSHPSLRPAPRGELCLGFRQDGSLEMGCRLRNDTRLIRDRIPSREFVRGDRKSTRLNSSHLGI